MKESFGFIERADVVKEIFFHFSENKSKDELELGDDVEFIIQTRNVSTNGTLKIFIFGLTCSHNLLYTSLRYLIHYCKCISPFILWILMQETLRFSKYYLINIVRPTIFSLFQWKFNKGTASYSTKNVDAEGLSHVKSSNIIFDTKYSQTLMKLVSIKAIFVLTGLGIFFFTIRILFLGFGTVRGLGNSYFY